MLLHFDRRKHPPDAMYLLHAAFDFGGFIPIEWEKRRHSEVPAPEIPLPYFVQVCKNRRTA